MQRTRGELAEAVAVVLGSSEALALATGVPSRPAEARAAADIAAYLLRTIADSYDDAFDLIRGSSDLASAVLV